MLEGSDAGEARADEAGQALIEYVLVVVVVSIAVIVLLVYLRDQLGTMFSNVGNNLT